MAKYKNRIYCHASLAAGRDVEITGEVCHYLHTVLRLKAGAHILLFNENDGEFAGEIIDLNKSQARVRLLHQERAASHKRTTITLYYAPIKNPNSSFYVQKATELGVDKIVPVITEYTVVRSVNVEKLEIVAIEALEQSMRLDRVKISSAMPLVQIVDKASQHDVILWCDEKADPKKDSLLSYRDKLTECKSVGVLIGPEGGFSLKEREYLGKLGNVKPVSLGMNILRAETAMIAVLSVLGL